MHQPLPPEFMHPQWFFPLFALMWAGISVLLAVLGGWSSLAAKFRARQRIEGERFRFVSGSMGARVFPVSYGSCLFVTVNEMGFRLSILFPFRLFSPPLFIPWVEVASVETKRFLFISRAIIRLHGNWPAVSVGGGAGERILEAYGRAKSRRR